MINTSKIRSQKNQMQRQEKGITLIALVITVIVLLILAGTAISIAVNGNNIFAKANTAVESYNAKANEQKTAIDTLEARFNTYYNSYNPNQAPGDQTPTKTLSSIEITTQPTKTSYIVGENLDLTGVVVTATYSDETTSAVTSSVTFTPANGATLGTAGTITITASYTEGEVTKTETTTVTVGAAEEVISKEVPTNHVSEFVGKYADINGDGTIDGIIYVDLLVQAGTSGQWADSDGTYSIPSAETSGVTTNTVKDYVISQTAQTDSRFEKSGADASTYTARDVVKLATVQTNTNPVDRFYVMGLDDIKDSSNNTTLYWYKSAYGNMNASDTSGDFGTGRSNTAAIKAKWDLGAATGGYGATDPRDLWGYLPTTPKAGANPTASESDTLEYRWFIPSRGEWSAFANAFGITLSNYGNFGLSSYYWASSQYSAYNAWRASFSNGYMNYDPVSNYYYVRVSATF